MSAATHYDGGCPKLTNKRPSFPIIFLRFGGSLFGEVHSLKSVGANSRKYDINL